MSGDAPAAAPAAPAASESSAPAAAPAAAPAESSAPRSTAQIAHNVIERDANAEVNGNGADHDEPSAELTAAERFSEEEALLREYGFKRAKKADGSEHVIPRSKVLSMIASGLKRGTERWNAEKQKIEQEAQQLRSFRDGFAESLRGDERQFLAYISQHDPRYKRFLEQQQAPPAQPQPPAHDPNEPQPDLDLGNGAKTFSPQGLQKWLDWAVEQRLEQRLAPITQEREQAKREAAAHQYRAQQQERVRTQIETAKTWPNWADYEGDVLKKLQADTAESQARGERPRMSLREAFLEVRAERLEAAGDPNRVRQQVIADINAAPKSTAIRPAAEVPRSDRPRSTQDIARAIVERSERGR